VTEAEAKHLKEIFSERERVLAARMDAFDRALELQAKEYARRLEELNHAHAEAREVLHTYVRQDVYETGQRELRKTADELSEWKAHIAADLAGLNARLAAYLVALTIFFTVVSITLNIVFNVLR
jgi:hypothetical protein